MFLRLRRHSGEGRNPVVYSIHSRNAGMTITGTTNRMRHPLKPGAHSLFRPPFLDSGLRRNDDEWRTDESPSRPSPPSCRRKRGARIASRDYRDISTPQSSFRRKPESSGLDNPFPHGGNDNYTNDNATRHPVKARHPLIIPASPSSAACSRRRSTTYVPVGVDSGLRRNDGGVRCHPGNSSTASL